MNKDNEFLLLTKQWRERAAEYKYMNNFSWMGRPAIQFPGDMLMMQELIWSGKPDYIIQTGIAHGGSLLLAATLQAVRGSGMVIGIDIDIRPHNKIEIESNALSKYIKLFECSSVDTELKLELNKLIKKTDRVIVFLDSNHTEEHVLKELEFYSEWVKSGDYIVVMDTFIEDLGPNFDWKDRPWSFKNNPKTAVRKWLETNPDFKTDNHLEQRILITCAPGGILRRI